VDGATIHFVGPRAAAPAGDVDIELGDVILMPGLVNAHIHLDLAALAGQIESRDFFGWIRALVQRLSQLPSSTLQHSARRAVVEQLLMGVTTIADTAPNRYGFDAMREFGVRGIAFREVFAPDPALCDAAMTALREAVTAMRADETPLVRVGVSPHAPYSVSDALYAAVAEYARAEAVPVAVHIAESPAETALVCEARGPFAEYLTHDRNIPVAPRGSSPIAVLARTGILALRPLCIHAVQVDAIDVHHMAEARATVAHCPCSNRWFGFGAAPLAAYRDAGIAVGLGTDSAASNEQVRIDTEARAATDESLSAHDRLVLATAGGAAALGLADRVGTLTAGFDADLAAFTVVDHAACDADPAQYLLDAALRRPAAFVMVAGNERGGVIIGNEPASRAGLALSPRAPTL
jgi:5-methylthioadenosine/S-adenosylhomocysteine deaminase